MDELPRSNWPLSTPVTAEVNRAMQEFTGVKYQTSDCRCEVSNQRSPQIFIIEQNSEGSPRYTGDV